LENLYSTDGCRRYGVKKDILSCRFAGKKPVNIGKDVVFENIEFISSLEHRNLLKFLIREFSFRRGSSAEASYDAFSWTGELI